MSLHVHLNIYIFRITSIYISFHLDEKRLRVNDIKHKFQFKELSQVITPEFRFSTLIGQKVLIHPA